ncbi:hypothetical protein AMECASPLE_025537 [Ameca splendens]|uniref:Uncharacterized protein n=1 Tax=Ameca splendens TaxID=208324 RepID=A0ABV0YS16_9TELE
MNCDWETAPLGVVETASLLGTFLETLFWNTVCFCRPQREGSSLLRPADSSESGLSGWEETSLVFFWLADWENGGKLKILQEVRARPRRKNLQSL